MVKKISVLMSFILIVILLSGCVDATLYVNINRDNTFDVEYKIVFNDKASNNNDSIKVNNEQIAKVKDYMVKLGFSVTEKTENLKTVLIAAKNDVEPEAFNNLNFKPDQNPLDILALNSQFNKVNMLSDKFRYDFKVNLSYLKNNILGISEEQYLKYLSELNLKFVITTTNENKITNSNAKIVSKDGKTLEWILIPGDNNLITIEGNHISSSFISTLYIVTGIILVIFGLLLLQINIKRKSKK